MKPYFDQDGVTLYLGDVLAMLATLPAGIVRTCVTSPPYWGLRDYGVDGQIGLESTPDQYVARMVEVFREVRRVLADDGTLWLNLGDSYATGGGERGYRWKGLRGSRGGSAKQPHTGAAVGPLVQPNRMPLPGLKPKDLVGIPWLVAFALRADGWYLRSEIIWHKPAPMPESVTDRPTRSHENVFLFAKSERYFYNRESARDPLRDSSIARLTQDIESQVGSDRANGGAKVNGTMKASRFDGTKASVNDQTRLASGNEWSQDPAAGANWRDVWTIPNSGTSDAHFAVMPTRLAERCVIAGSAPNDTVLDPFNGSGTTGEASQKHGRRYIGIDLNRDYLELSRKRFGQRVLFAPGGER